MAGPHWSGKNATLLFYLDNDKVILNTKSWSVKPNVTEVADGVCGEDRDRLQTIPNFYELQVEAFLSDLRPVIAMLKETANQDAMVLPLQKSVTLYIKPNDGSKSAFTATEVTLGAWELSVAGRTDRAMIKIPLRSRYFDATQTF